MIAAVMSRGYFGGYRRIGVREHRRIAGIFVFWLDSLDRPAGEVTDQGFLSARQNVHAEMAGFQEEACMRAFVATETTHKGGSSEPDMNALAVMPRTSPRTCVVMTVTPVTKEAITRRKRPSVTAPSRAEGDVTTVIAE